MKLSIFITLFISISTSYVAASSLDPIIPYLSVHSQNYSATCPVNQILHDLDGDSLSRGEFAYTHNQLEIGTELSGWTIGVFQRYDYLMQFSNDTARYMYQKNNDIGIDANEEYEIYLQANHLRSNGIGIGYKYSFSEKLSSKLRLNLLRSSDMTDGIITGDLSTSDDSYSSDLELDYVYGEDSILGRPPENISGYGYSIDIDFEWAVNDNLNMLFEGRDLLSRLRWDNITATQAVATTNTIALGDNGDVDLRPAISGVEYYKDHTQKLPARYLINGRYKVTRGYELGAEIFAVDKYIFPRILANWNYGELYLNSSYDFKAEAIGVGFSYGYIDMQLKLDSLNIEKANSIEFALNFSYPL